jgi:hypothetical protein
MDPQRISPGLQRLLKSHFFEQGRFNPFTYTVGLESSLDQSEAAVQNYPIQLPLTEDVLKQFIRSLTFFHEANHFCQYVSTGYGLRALRNTLICLRNLERETQWHLPIFQNLADQFRTGSLSEAQQRTFEGILNFLDVADQLRLHQGAGLLQGAGNASVAVGYLPWSPHFFFMVADTEGSNSEEVAEQLRGVDANVRRLPFLLFHSGPSSYQIVLNVATLLECAAVLCEINHVSNALRVSHEETMQFLPPANEYHAVMAFALRNGYCTPRTMVLTLGVCIDAALMFDPFVLYNVPWDTPDAEGRRDQYPGETFLQVLEASRSVDPIVRADEAEISRFYRAVCKEAGLPPPDWMAQKSLEVADRLAVQKTGPDVLLANALEGHRNALQYRCERPDSFPLNLPTTEGIYEVLGRAKGALSFYNLRTRQPDHFNPRKIDAITIHSILVQAFSERRIQCPLKMGHPFFCNSAQHDSNTLCVWHIGGERRECLVDILERQLGLVPAPATGELAAGTS